MDEEETYYILDTKNVLRTDDEPSLDEEFREDVLSIAPKTKDGYVVVEKGKWGN